MVISLSRICSFCMSTPNISDYTRIFVRFSLLQVLCEELERPTFLFCSAAIEFLDLLDMHFVISIAVTST
jgi:hypothetical protein